MRIISGKYKRKKLCTPKDFSTRPSTDRFRETVMGILEGGKFGYPLKSKILHISVNFHARAILRPDLKTSFF